MVAGFLCIVIYIFSSFNTPLYFMDVLKKKKTLLNNLLNM